LSVFVDVGSMPERSGQLLCNQMLDLQVGRLGPNRWVRMTQPCPLDLALSELCPSSSVHAGGAALDRGIRALQPMADMVADVTHDLSFADWPARAHRAIGLSGTVRGEPVWAGRYGDARAMVAPPADQVDDLLTLLQSTVSDSRLGRVERAALLFGWMLWIHPFADGNGRAARLVLRCALALDGPAPPDASCVPPVGLRLMLDQPRFVRAHGALRNGQVRDWIDLIASDLNDAAQSVSALAQPRQNRRQASGRRRRRFAS
jgi:Fic/DOC family